MSSHPVAHRLQVAAFTVLFSAEAFGAEAILPVRAGVIGYQDTVKICGTANAPDWCPEHLRKRQLNEPQLPDLISRIAPDNHLLAKVLGLKIIDMEAGGRDIE